MITDAQDHPLTAATPGAAAAFDRGIRAMAIGYGNPLAELDEAASLAPAMPMPLIAKAFLLAMPADPPMLRLAADIAARLRDLALNERERGLAAALDRAIALDRHAEIGLLDRHLLAHPRDLVAHYAALYADLILGRAALERERVARALPLFPADMPGHAALVNLHAFGLEEAGDYARAEAEARGAIAAEPNIYLAHHTVAHCMEMTGRPADGLAFSRERAPFWTSGQTGSRSHIWWHTALFHLELGEFDEALALHDGPMAESMRPMGFALSDPAALLWRLDTLGHDTGARWLDLLPRWDGHADSTGTLFYDIHAAMAELGGGRPDLVETRLAAMRRTAASILPAAALYREVGIPLVEGLAAFHRGDHAGCIERLMPVRYEIWRIGGSAAQRDVLDWTLTVAAIRGGEADLARGLVHERLGARPDSLINRRFRAEAALIAA